MATAATVNKSGLVASRRGWESAVASFEAVASMRRIVAADSSSASGALHAATRDHCLRAKQQEMYVDLQAGRIYWAGSSGFSSSQPHRRALLLRSTVVP